MDKIIIKDLEVFAHHGVLKEEKSLGQKFLLSFELLLDLKKAGTTDNLNETVNYAKLCTELENEFKRKKYDLIETAAEKTAEFILLNYNIIKTVKVTLKKPWAPILKPVDYVAVQIERSWHTVYIALGSNLGDKNKNLNEALNLIDENHLCHINRASNFYETTPVGYLDQDDFLNGAAEIKTLMSPLELMNFLLEVEKKLKRERKIHWGPRTIDLDILLYDDIVTEDEHIIIPHPRMHERLFVLDPLCDIAPYKVHPLLNKRIIDIKNELKKTMRK
ncbi:2-amino-4-hydroxy-6-hydroxymethyldihydropteridine diphosphokinase [Clostridium guangxiense]|uniref:2-amino-4-hydroxy-6- hydroxymethyldihydropteridine diphosphokinase n=1 Tax=Clostridium guangxiense TaxID=1662055 RepID=UPI001E31AF93|nr:2-amino-4-hydroxy-6-hydroxymethyldihydropteridine diphosphokinase [Clostridium guangxiense]MCD2346658.1 2-amino-4-hydroxy-6-hydroxymethyldihydropteridine diphosphokinase [Clostridium guangxiense]